jgi:predicted extracellular nuclease
MLVTFPQDLTISEYFNFDRYGEIVLSNGRFLTHTAISEPSVAEAALSEAEYQRNKIVLDDGRTTQNPDPAYHPNGLEFTLDNLFRGGDTVQNVTGTIYYDFNLYRVVPTTGADYTSTNPRTTAHEAVGGSLKVASFNVLNYFTTLGSRGADTMEEFNRQRDKIIAAISAIDADIVGLIEIENNTEAIADLVNGLNAYLSPGTYAYVDTGVIGTDEIKVAFIYKPAAVSLVGNYEILDSSVDSRFIDTKNRPVLAQTFQEIATNEKVTIAVNHLKSKGSACDGDPDLGDGAGNCNLTRTAAAEALVDWLNGDPTNSGDPDFLIIGDLNSYDKEDPIDAILAGSDGISDTADDYNDLLYRFIGEDAYSYVFDGRIGYLDHALANDSLNVQLTGTTVWHINADEPDLIDYDMTFKKEAQDAIYAPDPYRSSDHDPVIIGLSLGNYIPVTSGYIYYFPIVFK